MSRCEAGTPAGMEGDNVKRTDRYPLLRRGGSWRSGWPSPLEWGRRSRKLSSREAGAGINKMLKNSFSPRLLKKAQVQGGTPGTHRRWVSADGPFSAGC
jgi:hypothetical protein